MSRVVAGNGHAVGSSHDGHAHHVGGGGPVRIDPAAVTMSGGAGVWPLGLIFVGALGIVLTAIGWFTDPRHALASYHVGAIYTLGLALGSLMLIMIMQQFNAGWIVTCRRQLENVASLIPLALLLLVPTVATAFMGSTSLFGWTNPDLLNPNSSAFDALAVHKHPYLNLQFFVIRLGIDALLWTFLARSLYRWSLAQDISGDRWLTARSRFISSFGIILLALSVAFAGFDLIMSLDYHWFSTMFGVYFFIGDLLSAVALLVLILVALRRAGKLKGLVTDEHFHDLGKLLLAFTVFWAYITFSQYFLIWYSNLPEETGWYIIRRQNHARPIDWMQVGFMLCAFHFGLPFLLLLWRTTKRNINTIALMALWLLFMHFVDLTYMIRPSIQPEPEHSPLCAWWIDLGGWLGPTCIFLGFVAHRIARNPLIPLKDPRLHEALAHKNYI